MKIFLDTAEIDEIQSAHDTGLIDGITTNPTIIMKSGRRVFDVVRELSYIFSPLESISVEVVGDSVNEMLSQAKKYYTIDPHIAIKVPCTVDGLKVCKRLSGQGIMTNVTLIFTVSQAILAAKAGASYISPFIGRWEDNSVDGLSLIKRIKKTFHNMKTPSPQILAASIRDVRQIEECALNGADIVTIPPSVFWKMYKNVMTDKGIDQFNSDWEKVLDREN